MLIMRKPSCLEQSVETETGPVGFFLPAHTGQLSLWVWAERFIPCFVTIEHNLAFFLYFTGKKSKVHSFISARYLTVGWTSCLQAKEPAGRAPHLGGDPNKRAPHLGKWASWQGPPPGLGIHAVGRAPTLQQLGMARNCWSIFHKWVSWQKIPLPGNWAWYSWALYLGKWISW
jgi:hypothetical protein